MRTTDVSRLNGTLGEVRAEQYFAEKGCRILERNYRIQGAEIDLILEDGRFLVFCEVKLRSRSGMGREAVTPAKMKRVSRAALRYMVERKLTDRQARFDVLEVSRDGVVHIPNAFPYCGASF